MEFLKVDPFYIFTALVGLIVWFTRLESKNTRNEKDLVDVRADLVKIKEKHESLESELIKDLSEVKQALARIEGQISK